MHWAGSAAFAVQPRICDTYDSNPSTPIMVHLPRIRIAPLVLGGWLLGVALHASTPPALDLPDGFSAITAADAPVVKHPIMASLGAPGQLFVGDASGTNLNKTGLEKHLPNRLLLLTDTNSDGIYDRSSVFADRMTFPEGGVWLDGSFYVASPPGIWKLTDSDRDGVAEHREMLVGGFEYTGNAADVHGPFLHPNGRLYWCHGRKGHEVRQKNGTLVHAGLASGIWSCRPDGMDVRWHALGCADNPTEIDFTPEGEIVGTVNLYYGTPRGDTLLHWLRGGVYERSDQLEAIAGLTRTLDVMPVAHNFGHVAIAGCAFYRSGALDPAWRGQMFVAHFNTRRISRMEMIPSGASYQFREHEFLRARDPDAHLTDLIEDHDGSLLAINTGGWFQIGCPSSLMSKQDAPGAIYRIRRAGGPHATHSRWETRTARIWEWARRSDSESLKALTKSLEDTDPSVAHAAANALAARAQPETIPALLPALTHGDQGVQLAAAHALGEMSELTPEAVQALLARLEADLDRAVEHQVLFALARPGLASSLALSFRTSTSPHQKRRILALLDPLPASPLRAPEVLALLDATDAALANTAAAIIARHREWMPALTSLFQARLQEGPVADDGLARLETAATPWGGEPSVRSLVATLAESPELRRRRVAWRVIAAAPGAGADPRSARALARNLDHAEASEIPWLLEAAALSEGLELRTSLRRMMADTQRPLGLRLQALGASVRPGSALDEESSRLLFQVLREEKSPTSRLEAARCLSKASLNRDQKLTLAGLMASLSPMELRLTSTAISEAPDANVARAFARAMADSPALNSFQESEIRTLFSRWAPACLSIISPALEAVAAEQAALRSKLETLPPRVATHGRAEEGRKTFESGKGACSACHRVGEVGNLVGPNLSTIGKIRTERDLLESILFPSATIARDYEAHAIEITGGESLVGVVHKNNPEAVVIYDATSEERTLPRSQIVSMQVLATSLMPNGLDRAVTEEELLDLVAFLRSRQ